MVSRDVLEKQLERAGCNYHFWGRSEVAELQHVLMESETVKYGVNGHYAGGFALLCATDHRVLLIDKKPMNYLYLEDIRFEMISEFGFNRHLLDAAIQLCTPTKTVLFTSWNQNRLRELLGYVQQRVIEIRQYYYMAHQFQAMAAQQMQQPSAAAYVPNMAQAQPSNGRRVADTLGAYTHTKLPHFRRRNSRRLGQFAVPDEILPPLSSAQPRGI